MPKKNKQKYTSYVLVTYCKQSCYINNTKIKIVHIMTILLPLGNCTYLWVIFTILKSTVNICAKIVTTIRCLGFSGH